MPVRIRAKCHYGKWHNIEVEDEVTAYAEYANGATASFITTTGECPGTNRLEITGDRGKLVWEEGTFILGLAEPERKICFESQEGFVVRRLTMKKSRPRAWKPVITVFCRILPTLFCMGGKLLAPGEEGINGLTISNAIHLSDWTNDWVELPIDADRYLELLNEKRKKSHVKEAGKPAKIADLSGTYNDRWKVR